MRNPKIWNPLRFDPGGILSCQRRYSNLYFDLKNVEFGRGDWLYSACVWMTLILRAVMRSTNLITRLCSRKQMVMVYLVVSWIGEGYIPRAVAILWWQIFTRLALFPFFRVSLRALIWVRFKIKDITTLILKKSGSCLATQNIGFLLTF